MVKFDSMMNEDGSKVLYVQGQAQEMRFWRSRDQSVWAK